MRVKSIEVPMIDMGLPDFTKRNIKMFDGDLGMYVDMNHVDVLKFGELQLIPKFGEHYDLVIHNDFTTEDCKPFVLTSIASESDWDEMVTLMFHPLVGEDEGEILSGDIIITFPTKGMDCTELGSLFIVGSMYVFDMKRHEGEVIDLPDRSNPFGAIFGGKA